MTNSPHFPISSEWTPERTDLARRLWAQGISAAQIAARLGGAISRCSVVSKMHREKAPTGRDAPARPRLSEDDGRRARRDIHRSVGRIVASADGWRETVEAALGRPPRAEIDTAAFEPMAGTTPRPWETRRAGECAWPVDVAGETGTWSCCAPVQALRANCPAHLKWRRDPAPGPSGAALRQEADVLLAWLQRKGS